jgi:tRNA/rRNA methyltransferase
LFETLAKTDHRVALLLGSERYGLSNADVYRCHACISIPTHPGYGSLNLAQAVQLLAYDWRIAQGGFAAPPLHTSTPERADASAISQLLDHWQNTLTHIDFLNPQAPRKLMPRLQQLLNRAELSTQEVQILRGIARAVDKKLST